MKQLKRTLCLALVLMLLMSAVPASAATANSAAVCMEYYDIIKESIRNNGGVCEPSMVEVWDCLPAPDEPGLYYANVIDLDKDASPELVLIESVLREKDINSPFIADSYELCLRIYTGRGDHAVKILDKDFGAVWKWGYYQAANGNIYLTIYPSSGSDAEFYSVKNGQLDSKTFCSYVFGGGFGCYINGEYVWVNVPGYNTSASYYVNDQKVGVGEYVKQKNAMEKIELLTYGTETGYPANDTAYTAIAELEKWVPASFLAGYTTPSSWALDAVNKMKELNILPDHLQRMYNQPITRLHFCELAMEFYEYVTAAEIAERMDFTDTASEAVRKMGGLGVINGIGGGAFGPNDYLTREQAAVILARMADKLGWTLPAGAAAFADNAAISSWALEQVGRIQAAGIMNGTGNNNFSPKDRYTLEQSILTMLRMQNVQAPVTEVRLSHTRLEVLPGGHRTITATAYSNGAPVVRTFSWTSSDPAVVSVDVNTGVITCHKPGSAVITATSGGGGKAECRVTVPSAASNIYMDYSSFVGEGRSMPRGSSFDGSEQCRFRPIEVTYEQLKYSFDYIKVRVQIEKMAYKEYIYVDWNLYDADGELVCSGPTNTRNAYRYYDEGDTYTFSLMTAKLDPNSCYQLEFVDFRP